jgi:hypothetical protein
VPPAGQRGSAHRTSAAAVAAVSQRTAKTVQSYIVALPSIPSRKPTTRSDAAAVAPAARPSQAKAGNLGPLTSAGISRISPRAAARAKCRDQSGSLLTGPVRGNFGIRSASSNPQ